MQATFFGFAFPFVFFETESCYIALPILVLCSTGFGLKLISLLLQLPKYWDYRGEPSHLALFSILTHDLTNCPH
jgi:hypothetical protein